MNLTYFRPKMRGNVENKNNNPVNISSGVTDGRGKGSSRPPGKLNVKTGPPLADILIFNIP